MVEKSFLSNIYVAIIAIVCALSITIVAQNVSLKTQNNTTSTFSYDIQHYSVEDGLAESSIWSVHQDKIGFLWLGTSNGLNKFDGNRFHSFDDMDTLSRIWVARIIEDSNGVLYFKLRPNSIWKYFDNTFEEVELPDILKDQFITSIYLTQYNELMIGTFGAGLFIKYQNGWKRYTTDDGLLSDVITTIGKNYKNEIILLTQRGINTYYEGQFESVLQTKELALNFLLHDVNKRYWLCVYNDGLYLNIDGKQKRISSEEGLTVRNLVEDEDGIIWGATSKGLRAYDQKTQKEIEIPDILRKTPMNFIYLDRDKNIWAGTEGNGLFRISHKIFTNVTYSDGLPSPKVYKLQCMNKNGLFALSGGALLRFENNGNFRIIADNLSTVGKTGDIICKDSLLFYTNGEEIFTLKDNVFVRYGSFQAKGTISGLALDAENNLWFGDNASGFYKYQSDKPELLLTFHNIYPDEQFKGFSDSKGNVWFTTYYRGLYSFQRETIIHIDANNSNISDTVYDIVEDDSGYIWVSGYNGLHKLHNNNVLCSFGEAEGLPSHECTALLFKERTLYIGTTKGLSLYDGSVFLNYTRNNGLASDFISRNGLTSDNKGNIFIGTLGGLSVFENRYNAHNQDSIPLVITKIMFNDSLITESEWSAKYNKTHMLPSETKAIDISFSALVFDHPQNIDYYYKLEPSDTSWQRIKGNTLHLEELTSGEYTLHLKARTIGKKIKCASFHFSIEKPFYETLTFVLSVFIVLGLVIAIIVYVKSRARLHKQNNKYKTSKMTETAKNELISGIISYVEQNKQFLDPKISIALIAEHLNVRGEKISQVVNLHFNSNFNEYINRLRIEEAKKRMASPEYENEKILAIAIDVGFNNKTTFNAAFKKYVQMTPSEYRKSLRQK